jgi:hypothetical protein
MGSGLGSSWVSRSRTSRLLEIPGSRHGGDDRLPRGRLAGSEKQVVKRRAQHPCEPAGDVSPDVRPLPRDDQGRVRGRDIGQGREFTKGKPFRQRNQVLQSFCQSHDYAGKHRLPKSSTPPCRFVEPSDYSSNRAPQAARRSPKSAAPWLGMGTHRRCAPKARLVRALALEEGRAVVVSLLRHGAPQHVER